MDVRVRANEQDTVLGALEPGQSRELRFGAGEAAVFVNRGEGPAQLDVKVRGDTSLSMGYTPAP